MKIGFISVCLIVFINVPGFGQTPDSLFSKANGFYEKGLYGQAIEQYEQLLSQDYKSAELHYNLGNAYFKQKQLGKAILHYERAKMLDPSDADIRYNLAYAQKQVKGDIQTLPAFFLLDWWKKLRMLASSGFWGICAIILWWGGFAGLSIWLLGTARPLKKKGFLVGAACLILSLLPYSLALSRNAFEKKSRLAIVIRPTASLRSAPDEAGTEILLLYEGTKISLLDQIGDWHKVRLPDGETGWLPKGVMEGI